MPRYRVLWTDDGKELDFIVDHLTWAVKMVNDLAAEGKQNVRTEII